MHKYRTHNCNQLRKNDSGNIVRLSGWVHRKRDHGGVLFIDLRDHYGVTQLVFPQGGKINPENADKIRFESVITITGKVIERAKEAVNPKMPTGEIEVVVEDLIGESLVEDEQLPVQVNTDKEFPENTRLKYRFLDLRREKLHNNIVLRSKVISEIRSFMTGQGFMEFQTPILTASSPEGARDFLVPSRLNPGKFYALPQAPQQFKQLLMISGFDRYFQIAPCFRDEDARADRSPGEFYQLDMEMSFVTQEDVFAAVEPLMVQLFTKFGGNKKMTASPFPHIKFDDAMLKYGSDKPDLRNPLIISDATEVFRNSNFGIFAKQIETGAIVRAIPAPQTAKLGRGFFDRKNELAKELGYAGLGYIIFDDATGEGKGPIAKNLTTEQIEALKTQNNINAGDGLFFACGVKDKAAKQAGEFRKIIGEELNLLEKDVFKFCWITDFPYYEWDEEENKIIFSHNPFSMPQGGIEALQNAKTKEDLLAIKAFQYDIVCNGIELSSGAIRNHKPELMYKAFEIAGYGKEIVDEKFGGMIRAFKYGAPPHGGIAPGVDRMVMLLADEPNIREIIAFPLNQNAEDLLMNAPCFVEEKQLRELNIQLSPKAKDAVEKSKN
ncbi:MAG: aspartate--tRNA ligase [Rickettsiales bacterium]|nr:aspartate--tRNA ligase [Rickettsiales bacterium]